MRCGRERVGDLSTLELGCGLGLVRLGGGWAGVACYCVSDYDEDALAFARENARRAGVVMLRRGLLIGGGRIQSCGLGGYWGRMCLYEARNLEPVARFICDHLADDGLALLSDPCRSVADGFVEVAAEAFGLAVEAGGFCGSAVTA